MAQELERVERLLDWVSDIQSKVLWCRSFLDESRNMIANGDLPDSFHMDTMNWRRLRGLLPREERSRLKQQLESIRSDSLAIESSLDDITAHLQWLENITSSALESLEEIYPHAVMLGEYFPD